MKSRQVFKVHGKVYAETIIIELHLTGGSLW